MSVFTKRNLLVAAATFVVGLGSFAAIWGVPKFMKRSTTVTGQVSAYLLDDRGEVNGLLLTSGDQLRFGKQTGAAVATQIKVGDQVSVNGHAGTKTNYGREVRVESITANGQTIIVADHGPRHSHGPHDKRGPKGHDGRDDRPDREPSEAKSPEATAPAASAGSSPDPNAQPATVSSAPVAEVFKAAGTIGTHLVNGHGDVDGIILSSGEQVRFSPKVGKLIVTAEQGTTAQVNVEGTGVRNERGTVIRPTRIVVGNQTIVLDR